MIKETTIITKNVQTYFTSIPKKNETDLKDVLTTDDYIEMSRKIIFNGRSCKK